MAKIIMQKPADQIHSSDPFELPPKDNILFENHIDTTTNFILGEQPRRFRKPLLVTKNLSRSSMHGEILCIGKDKAEIKRQVFDQPPTQAPSIIFDLGGVSRTFLLN